MYIVRLILGVVFNMAIFAGLLLLPAGTWAWGRAWVFLGVVLIATVATVVSLPRELLDERMKPLVQKGQPLADKILVLLLVATFCGMLVFIPLDVFRLQLLGKPGAFVSFLGLLLFIVGWGIMAFALKANAFAAPVVKHQEERHQTVVDTGVYGVVRHPMYAGAAPMIIGMALWLESYAAALLSSVPIGILVLRILAEEQFLRRELQGYDAYTKRVRYRLIPFLW
jgi:protein-S-isoprenylcysteine O-methyltransferase Ste14